MSKKKETVKAPSYKFLVGASFPSGKADGGERHMDAGDVADDLPQFVVEVLLKQGAIEEVK